MNSEVPWSLDQPHWNHPPSKLTLGPFKTVASHLLMSQLQLKRHLKVTPEQQWWVHCYVPLSWMGSMGGKKKETKKKVGGLIWSCKRKIKLVGSYSRLCWPLLHSGVNMLLYTGVSIFSGGVTLCSGNLYCTHRAGSPGQCTVHPPVPTVS